MKALTVKNPWAWSILYAGKDVENRPKPTNHRGLLWIHSSKSPDANAEQDVMIRSATFGAAAIASVVGRYGPTDRNGYVLGSVDVIGCHHAKDCCAADGQLCSAWAMADSWHWELRNPTPLTCPFPEQGQLGLWNLPANP